MGCGREGSGVLRGKVLDPIWIRGTACGCGHPLRSAMSQRSMVPEENALRSDSDSSSDVRDPTSLVWAESEDAASVEHYEHNVDYFAIEAVGQNLVK